MSKTYKKSDPDFEHRRRREERKNERQREKKSFLHEPKVHRENDEDKERKRY